MYSLEVLLICLTVLSLVHHFLTLHPDILSSISSFFYWAFLFCKFFLSLHYNICYIGEFESKGHSLLKNLAWLFVLPMGLLCIISNQNTTKYLAINAAGFWVGMDRTADL